MRDLCKLTTFVFYHSSCNDLYKLEGAASNHSFIATCVSMSKHQINNKSLIVYNTEKFNTPDSATGSSYLEVFFRKVVLRNFEKLAGKLLCQSLRPQTANLYFQSECWKIRTRKNSVFGHISRSVPFAFNLYLIVKLFTLLALSKLEQLKQYSSLSSDFGINTGLFLTFNIS